MLIPIQKFGTTLISRPSGKEAYLAFQSSLQNLAENESIVIDFKGVLTLTPSWADEFLTPLLNKYKYGKKLELINTTNASVVETLKILEILP